MTMKNKLFQRNLGRTDRIIRAVIGIIAIGAWYFGALAGIAAIIAGVVAIMLLGTSATASCPLNSVANLNTMTEEEKKKLDEKGISYQK
jgi:predicted phage tail protein